MKGVRVHSYCCFVVTVLVVTVSLKCAASRPLPPPQNTTASSQGSSSEEQEAAEMMRRSRAGGVGVKEVIGSRPPRCDNRCNGCSPCEAIQVPANHHVGIQFTNYEPEGWKCKCGPSFYTP